HATQDRVRLGEWLVTHHVINRHQLFDALVIHIRHGARLGDALVWLGYVKRDHLEIAAAAHLGHIPSSAFLPPLPQGPRVSVAPSRPDPDTTRRLRRHP
ncbi:MAG: hypothetical protein KAI47_27945, partial [Deltaproteobacteria bacterium]|nr:hypothetical protein [Deltaproteobacteria bacterium]